VAVGDRDTVAEATIASSEPIVGVLSWRVRLRCQEGHSNIDEFDGERSLAVGYFDYLI